MLITKGENNMNKEELRELVKKHFNLVEPTKEEMSEEVVSEQNFGEIKTADGELTLTYEGEDLAVGLPIFIVTEDGNVPAPDGEHALEGGVTIETEAGAITEISAEEEEITEEVTETVASEETVEEKMEETIEEEVMEEKEEEIVMAIADTILPIIEEMKKDIEEMKSKFSETEKKVETFASQPAAERTKAEIKNRNHSKVSVDYNPLDENKKAQFERLLKIRNKK